MPKISKVVVGSRPGGAKPPKETVSEFMCYRCGRVFKRQYGNFPASHSPLFAEGGGHLPICNRCIDDLFSHYKEVLGDEEKAMHRICMKFDFYWNPKIFDMVSRANTTSSRVRSYISKANMIKYSGKTFDDTLDEENTTYQLSIAQNPASESPANVLSVPEIIPKEDLEIKEEDVWFWGAGFTADVYIELNHRFKEWTESLPSPLDPGAKSLYKQICILEVKISRDAAAGKPIESSTNSLNTLVGSVNQKPVQRAQEAVDEDFDSQPFGVGIRMCENSKPIPKPIPELEDVDHVVRYISIWFLGHLCKMLGIRNTYCKMYEDEMARLRVDRPELDDEDDDGAFNDIFGDTKT